MSNSFSDLKKNRGSNFRKAQEKVQKTANPQNSHKDERLWSLTIDKAGNGHATIRFLPAPKGEDVPFVQTWSHAFKGVGGWYIENCLSTINQPDPVNEMNSASWDAGDEDTARKRKRKLNYYANILVIDDPANPENNGKVFLFKFGKQIFDIINESMFPEDEDDQPVNVFDFWEGANFKLKSKDVNGFVNYTSSKFLKSKPLSDDDELLEKVWKKEYSLQQFIDPESDNFKSYEQLKARLLRVLGDEAAEFFGVADASMRSAPAPANNRTSESRQLLQEDDDEDDDDDVDLTSLDDDGDDDVMSSMDDDDEDPPFDLDDDDDLDSFQSLAD